MSTLPFKAAVARAIAEVLCDSNFGQERWDEPSIPYAELMDTLRQAGHTRGLIDGAIVRLAELGELRRFEDKWRTPDGDVVRGPLILATKKLWWRLSDDPPASEKPTATGATPSSNGNGTGHVEAAGETPPWRDPGKNTEDRLIALAHANPECVDWPLRKLGGTIERSHTDVRNSQWNLTRKENWELIQKERIRRMDTTEAFAEGYRDPVSDGWEPPDGDESDPESFQ